MTTKLFTIAMLLTLSVISAFSSGQQVAVRMTVAPGTEKVVIQINNYTNEFTIPSSRVLEISLADPSFILSLDCSNNLLTSLDVSNLINLQVLDCSNNSLSSLDVSNNARLERLDCYKNSLSALDVSNLSNLRHLYCYKNFLTVLDVSNNARLERLDCYNNSLTSLDVSNNARLAGLDCSNNSLSSLDVSKNARLRILSASEQRAVAEVFFNGSYGEISFNSATKRISIGQDFSFHLPKGANSGAGFSGILVGITHVATYADFFIILFLVTIIAFVVWMFLRKRK